MCSKTLLTSIVCGLIAIAVQPMSAAAATPSLAGSWQFVLTPTSPPTPPVTQIPGLATFTTDGSVIETDGTEFAISPASGTPAPNAATPGHGIWEPAPVPGSLYVQYISLELEADGALYAKNITTMVVTLNTAGNQFTGSYQTVQAIPAGSTKVVASGKVSGQLIPHNPLP